MNSLVNLAKLAVEKYVKERKIIESLPDLPKEFLTKKAGTFVTIVKNGNLRGCIGTYLPTKENIAKEIISNAISAASEDYRFGPIHREELSDIFYTVYIISEPEMVKDIKTLNPKKYGIIVKTTPIFHTNSTDVVFDGHLPHKSGLLLPDLEGINTVKEQISICCQKGGIDPSKEKIMIYKFTIEKYQ